MSSLRLGSFLPLPRENAEVRKSLMANIDRLIRSRMAHKDGVVKTPVYVAVACFLPAGTKMMCDGEVIVYAVA